MVTLIGQRGRVAVEFALRPAAPQHRQWLFGRMCLWIGGHRIGRHDEDCALTVALTSLAGIPQHAGNRADADLMAMPATAMYETLYAALYADPANDESHETIAARARRYERFEITTSGFDYFDGWKAFLVEDAPVGRAVWRAPDATIREAHIAAGEFDRVLDGFLRELERVSGQARPQPPREGRP
jgi:hypothetical protein